MSFLLNIIPAPYRILAVALLAVALVGFGWVKGAGYEQDKALKAQAAALKEKVRVVTLQGAVTTRVETKYVPQIARAQVITETIVKEVPVYVPTTDPDLSGGFRVLHDAAALGVVPDPASVPHAASVPAQTAAASIAENYGSCREAIIRLDGLQEWVREQQQVK